MHIRSTEVVSTISVNPFIDKSKSAEKTIKTRNKDSNDMKQKEININYNIHNKSHYKSHYKSNYKTNYNQIRRTR